MTTPKKSSPLKPKINRIQITKSEDHHQSSLMRWYVIQVYSGSENNVMDALNESINLLSKNNKGLAAKFEEVIVPTEEVIEIRGGQQQKSERKFFPGYVLVKMEMDDETWHLIRQLRKVLKFVGGKNDKPIPISEVEANKILQRIEEGADKPRHKTLFEPGEVIRVTEGPFADFNGVVEEVNYEKSKLRVAVLIFGRSTPVELEFGQVTKA